MVSIQIRSKTPDPAPGQITAWIDLGGSKTLASKDAVRAHAGYTDVARRMDEGVLSAPYLSATAEQLLVLPGAAAKHFPDGEKIKTLAARALAIARERLSPSLVYLLDTPRGADAAAQLAEGLALGDYRFDKYRSNASEGSDPEICFVVPSSVRLKVQNAVDARLKICESVNRARDLVNEPGSVATPAEIEARARAVAEERGLEIETLDHKQLAKEGYEGLLAVGRAGNVKPRMIVMRYRPSGAKDTPHLGLLGKGLTFDTGGISIKPASKMWEMKGDMSGAAAVIYGMDAIAAMKPKIRVTAIIVTAQNYIGPNAMMPGDIIRARNGKTIHVDNTDAEGRLILTDGLWRAGEEGLTHLVDVATLTGSIVRALGTDLNGSFGNDGFADRVTRIAGAQGEPCWRLPLVERYIEKMKCDVADINNIGNTPNAGSITAALFLREFVPEGPSWVHLDIAGTFLLEKPWKYLGPGATGVMVRTFTALAQDLAAKTR